MGSCTSKPLVQGETPLLLAEEEPSTHGAKVDDPASERTVTKMMMMVTTTPPPPPAQEMEKVQEEEERLSDVLFQNKEMIIESTKSNEEPITEITEIIEDFTDSSTTHEIGEEVMLEDSEEQIISIVEDLNEAAPKEITASPSQTMIIPQVRSESSLENVDLEEKVVDSEEIVVVEPADGAKYEQIILVDKRCK